MSWWTRHFGGTTRGRIVALLRRGSRSVEDLAAELGLTDNAVRAQLVTLQRDGVVAPMGIRREGTVGKPATEYGIAPDAGTLFSNAYAPVLVSLLDVLGERHTRQELVSLMRTVGRRLAPEGAAKGSLEKRAKAAASMLGELGGDADLVPVDGGWDIRGHGCPLASAVVGHPETCRAVETMLAEATGTTVREHCDRSSGAPCCRFNITAA
ncbi:MAG: ArsR family transcriptional regulator [Gemmatimonadaceae bacterium]|nr:ArsR family transcriptional regulator [Gemmatimonadaceae bacterium]NUQ93292.1 ArsR family transcriptional regulator [Gemmatimonadaceae bacterium]NUR18928.1 ArsR family transcriptional regulator [Gemmatimonadaceae bacterium]NUS98825.1 ArsR family transcriptional regulator [Gemmatimonadaceae bacterium]